MPDVVLPVLDEADALPWVLSRMPRDHRPIVVDNASIDGSAEIARGLGALVISEPRAGYGAACAAGLQASTAEVVCFMDCDGTLDPGCLPYLTGLVTSGEADLVLGRRIADKGAWAPHARLANMVLARWVRIQSGAIVHDISPLRIGRRDHLAALSLEDRRCGLPLETIIKAAASSWRITEVPVPYRVRYGRSKVTGTVRGTLQTATDMWAVLR